MKRNVIVDFGHNLLCILKDLKKMPVKADNYRNFRLFTKNQV
jgi:hypothetical protein